MISRSRFAICLLACAFAAGAVGCAHRSAPEETGEKGFEPIFNGHDLTGWTYGPTPEGGTRQAGKGYQIRPEDQVIYSTVEDGGVLFTNKEYDNFVMRYEFKLTPAANNGIGIRSPLEGNPSYRGMEIQILDDDNPKYAHLHPEQYCGSVYGVVAAERGHLKPLGEWNSEEIYANGPHIVVTLNGARIVDTDLSKVTDEALLAKHPGIRDTKGHIALLGHGAAVEFRNLRVKQL
jgi:hypothetical protein